MSESDPGCASRKAPSTEAAQEVGYKSGDSVGLLVERRNQHGLAALLIAPGRGRKETYTSVEREHVVQEFRRAPDRQDDARASWSPLTLRGALRKEALPQVGVRTIREVVQEAGYRFGKTCTWCPTGTAIRVRKAGTVTVQDPKAGKKRLIEHAYAQAEGAGLPLWCQAPIKPCPSREKTGTLKASRPYSRTRTCVEVRPSC